MRTLKTSEAARLLNVSPNTLRSWERRFSYPNPRRSPGRQRLYLHAEVSALRAALDEGLSISSAVSVASEAIRVDGHSLVPALESFRAEDADRAMERSLALRSLEATIDDVLLLDLAEIRRRKGLSSAAWAFAAQWAADWLSRYQRLTPVAAEPRGILIGDATDGALDPAGPYLHALALCCARAGATVLALPVRAVTRVSEPISVIAPAAVVIAGDHATDDEVARWAYSVRQAAGDVPFLLFHRGLEGDGNGSGRRRLPPSPVGAQTAIAWALRDDGAGPAATTGPTHPDSSRVLTR